MNDRKNWRNGERSVRDQASYAIAAIVASGGTRIRSHAQIDSDCGLERFVGVRDALADHTDVLDSQIVAFPQAGILRETGVKPLLDEALREGADLVGGLDPVQYDRDPSHTLTSSSSSLKSTARVSTSIFMKAGQRASFLSKRSPNGLGL